MHVGINNVNSFINSVFCIYDWCDNFYFATASIEAVCDLRGQISILLAIHMYALHISMACSRMRHFTLYS